ncbi:hypothetical protein MAR_027476 [Mya arenaria]|uniref:Uncharacterized protein n=1 Tax=Mya arenaria TaxID=6604 RepID=A0ABY7EX61_MYAAR|nr:hypothetical protein MAR_027476 [Mya arenaria]
MEIEKERTTKGKKEEGGKVWLLIHNLHVTYTASAALRRYKQNDWDISPTIFPIVNNAKEGVLVPVLDAVEMESLAVLPYTYEFNIIPFEVRDPKEAYDRIQQYLEKLKKND